MDTDGDGLTDTAESGLGVAQVAPGDADTDGDGLKDAYETAIDGNANDGFVVSEGVTDVLARAGASQRAGARRDHGLRGFHCGGHDAFRGRLGQHAGS